MLTKFNFTIWLIICLFSPLCVFNAMGGYGTEKVLLSGQDSNNTIDWDFYCTEGRNSGKWTKIPVPSNWELMGFGTYNYGHDKNKATEQGIYKTKFNAPNCWQNKCVKIVFEGVMTDTAVFVNGTYVSAAHQGGFYEFEYDITKFLHLGIENSLEVKVGKVSSNHLVEQAERKADYWVFGGIYRPVYLKILPQEHIDWVAIDAKANGDFVAEIHTENITKCDNIKIQIIDKNNNLLAKANKKIDNNNKTSIKTHIQNHKTWTAETPNLYWAKIQLYKKNAIVHDIKKRFGFRTFEIKPTEGLYLNGKRILLKGANRHCFWPSTGRAVNETISYKDAKLIKSMNMNAVRMSHYPPEKEFLNACDEIGLYVLDELAGWQKPAYDTETGKKLIKEMLKRDVCHPSILFWDNGNEGGWNTELDNEFNKYDPQKRPVLHPWEKLNGIDTDHYETYDSTKEKLQGPLLFMPTEFLHGLYDGGHGAGLEDYWKLMKNSKFAAGGFLWALVDEGVVRTDKNNIIDTDGNHGPDGIVGPYREKEASYYAIKEIWSPVFINNEYQINKNKVTIKITNKYSFTNLNAIELSWQLVDFANAFSKRTGHEIKKTGHIEINSIAPAQTKSISFNLPNDWKSYDSIYINAKDLNGNDIWTWAWPIKSRQILANIDIDSKIKQVNAEIEDDTIMVKTKNTIFSFDKNSGLLKNINKNGKNLLLCNGPKKTTDFIHKNNAKAEAKCLIKNDKCIIQACNSNGLDSFQWTVTNTGTLKLSYQYSVKGDRDYFGITFDCPENNMVAMRWLGRGPHNIWKNRRKGTWLDVWQKEYTKAISGENWNYPVFAGYYDNFYWLDINTKNGSIKIFNQTDELFFRIGQLRNGSNPANTKHLSPSGDISFMHAISPIGTKFNKARNLGPTGKPTPSSGSSYKGKLIFVF